MSFDLTPHERLIRLEQGERRKDQLDGFVGGEVDQRLTRLMLFLLQRDLEDKVTLDVHSHAATCSTTSPPRSLSSKALAFAVVLASDRSPWTMSRSQSPTICSKT